MTAVFKVARPSHLAFRAKVYRGTSRATMNCANDRALAATNEQEETLMDSVVKVLSSAYWVHLTAFTASPGSLVVAKPNKSCGVTGLVVSASGTSINTCTGWTSWTILKDCESGKGRTPNLHTCSNLCTGWTWGKQHIYIVVPSFLHGRRCK